MRKQRFISIATTVFLLGFASSAWAQIESTGDVPSPTPKAMGPGAITPFFWIGVQAVEGFGYNFENKTYGFDGASNTNDSWASMNVAFVDSHYDTPKLYEVGNDPDIWTGHVKILNFTWRLDTYSSGNVEINKPAWLAEITGHNFAFGLFTQAGDYVATNESSGANDPAPSLSGGNLVMYFNNPDATGYDVVDDDTPTKVTYKSTSGSGYAGYVKPDLFSVYLSALSEGSYETTTETSGDGMAAALDFHVTPFGEDASEEHPFTPGLTGNFIGATKMVDSASSKDTAFGAKLDCDIWLGNIHEDWILTPVAAFDGKYSGTDYSNMTWEAGGGFIFAFSGKRWVSDTWNELEYTSTLNTGFGKYTYESNKILKYAYAQVYGCYSDATDLDLAVKFEEPDGTAGFDENLGFMGEFRYNNVAKVSTANSSNLVRGWSAVGRVSYDLRNHTLSPYLRAYYNSDGLMKLRTGIQAGIIPHAGFELAYMSPNLLKDVGSTEKTMGLIQFLVCINTNSGTIMTPKHMYDWNGNGKKDSAE